MEMYDTTQAAEKLGVTRRRVLAMIRAGRLKATMEHSTGFWYMTDRALKAVATRKPGRPTKKRRRVRLGGMIPTWDKERQRKHLARMKKIAPDVYPAHLKV